MIQRAMIVVGGGSSLRFGSDKLMELVNGEPLMIQTVKAVLPHVDRCVLVCRADQQQSLNEYRDVVSIVPGGATRTSSEMAGLAELGGYGDLIGIHDAARPLISGSLIRALYDAALETGAAIPVMPPEGPVVDRETLEPYVLAQVAQTPQVFKADVLLPAYVRAAREGFEGKDTAEIVAQYTDQGITAVAGEASNIKVTYPSDLTIVSEILSSRSHT